MTHRLYYTDSLLTSFDATVTSCVPHADVFHVTFDQTAFYPTSGGQPFDRGSVRLNSSAAGSVSVLDVIDDERTGDVVHVLSGALEAGANVTGQIDWPRRLDHMQQHTGQHVLSAALDRLFGVRTVSFHMGAESSTIDLSREVSSSEISGAEREACRVVWDDRPLNIRFASEEEAAALPLRKESARTGTLRLVEVPDFDLSACGGTHVLRTGMVGIIAISGWERFKGGTRVSFVCGGRALQSHTFLRESAQGAARGLTVAVADLPDAVLRMQAQIKDQQRTIKQLQEQVTAALAADLAAAAEPGLGTTRVVIRAQPGWDIAALKFLASAIVSNPGLVVVLTGEGTPVPVVVARSADVSLDAGAWIKDATSELGGRGGGRPELAQGGITAGTHDIIARANRTLKSH